MKTAQPPDIPAPLSSTALADRSQQIQAEIQATLGFIPSFFSPAIAHPAVLENLWRQTQLAYLDNPLPALFKEKLSAYLSRFCAVPYCMICHSCSLYKLGMEAAAVLQLLESPLPLQADLEHHLAVLAAHPEALQDWPHDPELETSILYCAIALALQDNLADDYRNKYLGLIKPKTQNAVSPASRAIQHFGF